MIVCKEEFKKFFNYLPELIDDEVFFISLSARNKYLSSEEREKFAIGRTEMFSRELIFEKSQENFDLVLKKLSSSLLYKTTNNGLEIPNKCIVTYFNLNPISTIKSVHAFENNLREETALLISALKDNKHTERIYKRFKNCQSLLRTELQKHRSRKIFIDVDIDHPSKKTAMKYTKDLSIFLSTYKVVHFIIETFSGYHVVIKKDTMFDNAVNKAFYSVLIPELNKKFSVAGGEVIINKNEMVPLPGTLQAGELVKIVDLAKKTKF